MKQLKKLQKVGEDALAAADVERLVEANANLHATIAAIGRNKVLAEMIGLVDRRVRWYYTPIARPRSRDSWNEHAELIAAIADGDAERAGQVMHLHAEQTRQTYHDRKTRGERLRRYAQITLNRSFGATRVIRDTSSS